MLDRVLQAVDRGPCFERMDDRQDKPRTDKHAVPVAELEEGLRKRRCYGGTEEEQAGLGDLGEATTAFVVKPPSRVWGVCLGKNVEGG